jgi:O-antigen/teichoic acid export membrane protein
MKKNFLVAERSLMYVTTSTLINNFSNFIIQVVAARALGVREFGIFSLAFSVSLLVGAIGDFGLNLTTIRLFNKYNNDFTKQKILLGSILGFKFAIFVGLLVISLPLGYLFAHSLTYDDENWILFAVALATGGLIFFWTYLQSLFQCYRQFNKLATYILLYSGLRLIALAVTYVLIGKNSLTWLLATYTIPTLVLFTIGLIPVVGQLSLLSVLKPQSIIKVLEEAIGYSKWVALSGTAYISMPYLIRFILAVSTSVEEVGIFSAGMTFALAFSTLNSAVRAVLFPQVTALEGQEEMKKYLKRHTEIARYYCILAVLGIAFLGIIQWFILGKIYRQAMPVFLVTAITLAFIIFIGLVTMLVHTMMRPQIDAWINVIRLGLMLVFALILIPPFKALGAAVAYAVPLLLGEIWMVKYISKELLK